MDFFFLAKCLISIFSHAYYYNLKVLKDNAEIFPDYPEQFDY